MISTEAKYNIIGQIKNFWDDTETLPTGKPLEKLIKNGLLGFYSNVCEIGNATTIVDVGKDNDAYDIKGLGCITYSYNQPLQKHTINNYYINHSDYNIWIKIPKKISTQVRRPNVDLENYSGDPEIILKTQIQEYATFAIETSKRDGYDKLYSFLVLYGNNSLYKTLTLSISPFAIPETNEYSYSFNKSNVKNGYLAKHNDEVKFSLSSFNKGSSNFYKTFEVTDPITYTWKIPENNIKKYNYNYLTENGVINENN
jgi:hypothetical protein